MDHCIYRSIVASIAVYIIISLHYFAAPPFGYISVFDYSGTYVSYYCCSIQSIKILMDTSR